MAGVGCRVGKGVGATLRGPDAPQSSSFQLTPVMKRRSIL